MFKFWKGKCSLYTVSSNRLLQLAEQEEKEELWQSTQGVHW